MSIRLRLALWYAGFLAAMFLLFAPVAYLVLESQLLQETDRWLTPVAQNVLRSVNTGDPSSPLSVRDSDLDPFASPGVFVELLDPNGRVIARSSNFEGRAVPAQGSAFTSAWWGEPTSYMASHDGSRYRGLLVAVAGAGEPRGFVLVLRSLQQVNETLGNVRLVLVAVNVAGLLLALAVGWLIARNSLRPIEAIIQTARSIAQSQGFGRRLMVWNGRDEIGRLASTLNEMLASLDAAYAAQRRFVADASHELRSPITSIRTNIDILRRAPDAPKEEREEALADVAAEVDRMSRLVSDLLLLARADAGHRIEMKELSLDGLIRDVHRQMDIHDNGVSLELGSIQEATVKGNDVWLKQLLLILLDNAFKYTPKGGSVSLSLTREADTAVVQVRDTGIGISADDIPHLFERFYRGDKARVREEGGAGLGLAIAKWIAEEHRGELAVETAVGGGTTFSLKLAVSH